MKDKNLIAILANATTNMFFTEEEKKNYCEECLKKKGNLKKYSDYLFDTGMCNSCGITGEVINEKIANSIPYEEAENYYMYGGKRIFRNT